MNVKTFTFERFPSWAVDEKRMVSGSFEKSLKEKHYEMWDYVINKIKAAQRMTACCTSCVPSIYRLKEEFFNAHPEYEKEKVPYLCFACKEAERVASVLYRCDGCPLTFPCNSEAGPYHKLLDLVYTDCFDEAIWLAQCVKDSWR